MNDISLLNDLNSSLKTLAEGGVILYPTDTIWGIGCDATNSKAIEKVFGIKKRAESKSLIILVDSEQMLAHYVSQVPDIVHDLIEQYDRPLTIIYPSAQNLPRNLVAPDGSIAIRVVRHPFCQQLISRFGKPITSTSANISGMPSPASFQSISAEVLQSVDYTVFYDRENPRAAIPSTIIRINLHGEFEIIRG
ncbi:MAG: L-threonylcarbamoyladenylate synthase [Bacteroidales bacterium]|jgi:L-threonylcarbamoyladenylate synthase|nr:L-threonylcarbamoyladenylate synthase [Bacteroidales bacterium]MDD3664984.1 L-threonylcarbamoyladenylate synthase [Bacteroidales bacterium]